MKNESIKLSGMLCIITLVAALLLAGVNMITEERIAVAAQQATENAMKNIITEADSFENLSEEVAVGKKDGSAVGYCVKVSAKGFGGDIEMIVGLSADDKVIGIEVISHSETAGLGSKAQTPEFRNQFSGKNTALSVVKTPTDSPDEIQAITGATITSKAIAAGVADAREILQKELNGGNK